ncbi:MAG: hypothetical protein COW02_12805 [Comamonadaceae bacterium CG12_big_fil_rev_8_21_14_0_65_59_15]|uniref:N-acetylmuramoyl-L-alanine amidase domain-containing protein n=1 Tax=bacterium (Candidatus Blackallbacteria) CG17_big_fil_post_rev_8_21_14_2_50_48_46 TaxID=2014261 RepID=A0A2M7G244_9BACT|nr:MAG: hypothetical protein COW64_16355 [bacterium (Candidatus Blackallbacteria) CG18_big_fil_WC_8_21_14_2_50_49_26]PIQ51814.1 MAG: hypothetical protein COW02_12805 [Comamonadaceae bacterium CG12_big_fil_rev_8_21_14_0_65_59_15]PIW15852.1 MAG: hypothetical protein COW36_15385 [bacterium (Candidatus Blackallbacteria) CG17_big_fil_post_rev_8_21_14_2_50_48_46]PIW49421.1 MAG: hypothetical protein COW20_05875 [bacterium (Candidatus Blackallbacteria) CG13_big_fil_rev_8_21_14_2_50_49_14]
MLRWSIPGLMIALGLMQTAQSPASQVKTPDYKACGLEVRLDRARPLADWKKTIAGYSERHYAEKTWELKPQALVMHYTAGEGFPWNLVNSKDFAGETPGLASHYVVDGETIWEVLPPFVRSRATYGINHRALSIEMVARDAQDLAHRPSTLKSATRLASCLMRFYQIPEQKLYSHQAVSRMNPAEIPEVKDLIDAHPYHKVDPGENNMATIRKGLRQN